MDFPTKNKVQWALEALHAAASFLGEARGLETDTDNSSLLGYHKMHIEDIIKGLEKMKE